MKKKIKFKNGDEYFGQQKKGLPHGIGNYRWSDGSEYKGYWKNNKMHGKGTLYDEEGKHIGIWKNGKSVSGKTIGIDGSVYKGEWSEFNIANGYGIKKYKDGAVEEGVFNNSLFNKGVLKLEDGSTQIGEWDNNYNNISISCYTMFIDKKKSHECRWYGDFKIDKKKFLVGEGICIETKQSKPSYFAVQIGKFINGSLKGFGQQINFKNKTFKEPISFNVGKFNNGILSGEGLIFQKPFDTYEKGKIKDGKIKKVSTHEMTKKIYEEYVKKAENFLVSKKYSYLTKNLKKYNNYI